MIDRQVTTIIDQEKCNGCELCVKVCPSETISMQDGKAHVTGDQSLQCGHCVAVCPVDAVRVDGIDDRSLSFNTFDLKNRCLPPGDFDTAHLVHLMEQIPISVLPLVLYYLLVILLKQLDQMMKQIIQMTLDNLAQLSSMP